LEAVLELAKIVGMSEVAEVSTFYYIPGHFYRGILVTGPEKVDGRKITFQTLGVFREGWSSKAKPTGPGQASSIGQFWIESRKLADIHELTTFATAKGIIRVAVQDGIPIETADKIINAFTNHRIQYANDFDKEEMENPGLVKGSVTAFDFSHPDRLRLSGVDGGYQISFSKNLDQFLFTLNGDDVKIVSVIHMRV